MSIARIRKPALIVLSLLLALAVLGLAPQPAAPAPGGNAIALVAPPFIGVAHAQEGPAAQDAPAAAPMGFPQDEAGISAYFKSASPISLADVRGVFRVIEAETADYIIGSVPVADYAEVYDVHVYIHRTGWFMAYYFSSDPVAKIFDWRSYAGGTVPTIFEKTLAFVAASAGVSFPGATYYDFRYPNATHLMFIVEDTYDGNTFDINLTGSYSYYSRSWALNSSTGCDASTRWAKLHLDGTQIGYNDCGYRISYGTLTAAQLLPDSYHTFTVELRGGNWANGGLALVYRVP